MPESPPVIERHLALRACPRVDRLRPRNCGRGSSFCSSPDAVLMLRGKRRLRFAHRRILSLCCFWVMNDLRRFENFACFGGRVRARVVARFATRRATRSAERPALRAGAFAVYAALHDPTHAACRSGQRRCEIHLHEEEVHHGIDRLRQGRGREAVRARASAGGGEGSQRPTPADAAKLQAANSAAGDAILDYVKSQNLSATGLTVTYDGATSTVSVFGVAPDQATREKIVLCCGNVAGVVAVKDMMSVDQSAPEAKFYTVCLGRHAVEDLEAVLWRREQVQPDLRGEQADAEVAGQDLSRPEPAHPAGVIDVRSLVAFGTGAPSPGCGGVDVSRRGPATTMTTRRRSATRPTTTRATTGTTKTRTMTMTRSRCRRAMLRCSIATSEPPRHNGARLTGR